MKLKTLPVIRVAVTLVLMTALIYMVRGSIPKMFDAITRLSVSILFLGFLLFLLSNFIVSFRLKILLDTQDIFLTIPYIVRLTFMSYFFSSFLPTSVGGDVVKAIYISKASNRAVLSYTSVFIDRFIGMVTIFLIAITAFFYTKEAPKTYFMWLLLLLAISGLFLIFLFNRRFAKIFTFFVTPLVSDKLKEIFRNIYDAMHNFKNYRLKIMECFAISILGQAVAFAAIYVFALGLNSYISFKFALFAMSMASIVSMLPSIYGMGPREMSIVVILGPVIGKDKALAIAFLWLGLLLTTALIGGIIYGLMGQHRIRPSTLPK